MPNHVPLKLTTKYGRISHLEVHKRVKDDFIECWIAQGYTVEED